MVEAQVLQDTILGKGRWPFTLETTWGEKSFLVAHVASV